MNVPSSLLRARAAFELQQFDVARRHALAAVAEHPESAEPHFILGKICLHQGKWADARSHAGEVLGLAPNFFAGYWLLGWGWLLDRDTDIPGNLTGSSRPRIEPARAAAKTAVTLAPEDEFNHLLSGAVEFEDGNVKAALNHIDAGLALNPSSYELLTWRGRVLHTIGKLDAAEGAFLDSLKIRPEDPDTHFFLARLQTGQCRFRAAMPHIREVMRLTPDSEEGAKLYWELIKTQHLLLRAVAWLDVKCQPIRRRQAGIHRPAAGFLVARWHDGRGTSTGNRRHTNW